MNRTILNVSLVLFGVLCGLGISLLIKENVAQAAGPQYLVVRPEPTSEDRDPYNAAQKTLNQKTSEGWTFDQVWGGDGLVFKK